MLVHHFNFFILFGLCLLSTLYGCVSANQQQSCLTGNNTFNVTLVKRATSGTCAQAVDPLSVIFLFSPSFTVTYCYFATNLGWFSPCANCISDRVSLQGLVDDNGTPFDTTDDFSLSSLTVVSGNPLSLDAGETVVLSKTVTINVCSTCRAPFTNTATALFVDINSASTLLGSTNTVQDSATILFQRSLFALPVYTTVNMTVPCYQDLNTTTPIYPTAPTSPLCPPTMTFTDPPSNATSCRTSEVRFNRTWTIAACGSSFLINQLVILQSNRLAYTVSPTLTVEGFAGCIGVNDPRTTAFTKYLNPNSFVTASTPSTRITSSCGPTTQSYEDSAPSLTSCAMSINRTWTVSDSCQSLNRTQVVIVRDTSPPGFSVIPANQEVTCRSLLNAGPTMTFQGSDAFYGTCTVPTSPNYPTDACILLYTDSLIPSRCPIMRTTTASLIDPCGFSTNATAVIYSTDMGPFFVPPSNVPQLSCTDYLTRIVTDITLRPTVSDCVPPSSAPTLLLGTLGNWTCGLSSFGFPLANLNVEWSYNSSDSCYSISYIQAYTIADDATKPSVIASPVFLTCTANNTVPSIAYPVINSTCSPYTITSSDSAVMDSIPTATQLVCGKKIDRTYTLFDVCTNPQGQTISTIYFVDNLPPTITILNEVVNLTCGSVPPVPTSAGVTADDGCFGTCQFVSVCPPILTGASRCQYCAMDTVVQECCSNSSVVVRTWMAVDVCGQVTTKTQTFIPTGFNNCSNTTIIITTPCPTPTPTQTPTPIIPTPVPIPSTTPTVTPTSTPVPIPSTTPTVTPTSTPVQIPSTTPTVTPTFTPTQTPTSSPRPTPTTTPTSTPTCNETPKPTPTPSPKSPTPTGSPCELSANPEKSTLPGVTTIYAGFTIGNIPKGGTITVNSATMTVWGYCVCSSSHSSCTPGPKYFSCNATTPISYTSTSSSNWYPTYDKTSASVHQIVCKVPANLCGGPATFRLSDDYDGEDPITFKARLSSQPSGFNPQVRFHADVSMGSSWSGYVTVPT